MKSPLCFVGLHKWDAVEGTIQQQGWYTEEADIICRHCGKEAHGQRYIV